MLKCGLRVNQKIHYCMIKGMITLGNGKSLCTHIHTHTRVTGLNSIHVYYVLYIYIYRYYQ